MGEELRSAIRGFGARLRSLRLVAGVVDMVSSSASNEIESAFFSNVSAAKPRSVEAQKMRNV